MNLYSSKKIELNQIQEEPTSYINETKQKQREIIMINNEILYKRTKDQVKLSQTLEKVKELKKIFSNELCVEHFSVFWTKRINVIYLPYELDFKEQTFPTKTRPIKMNQQFLEYGKMEINEYLDKGLIRKSKLPWNCSSFYIVNSFEIKRGTPRLVINYNL